MNVAVCWFRRNLRLADNAALEGALDTADTVVPAFVFPESARPHGAGLAGARWLEGSLAALDASLARRGSRLVTRCGDAPEALVRLAQDSGATAVWCERVWTPEGGSEERAVSRALATLGVALRVTDGAYLVDPDALATRDGRPYHVFTPFWTAWTRALDTRAPRPAPDVIPAPPVMPASAGPLTPGRGGPDVARWWTPGASAARTRTAAFCDTLLADYPQARDIPGVDGTSRLSPHLAWGETSPRQVAHACVRAAGEDGAAAYLRQLAWREFSAHVLHAEPAMPEEPLRSAYAAFPWSDDEAALERWKRGMTGYPLVDAGMRQLLATGWMHNRVRMVAASFLAKDLLVDWRLGAAHFAERLVDFDVASNAFNWQWVAGCGADAAPYFRIFNPVAQSRRFDPDADYIREWVPELAGVPARWIHEPWKAPAAQLEQAGVRLGATYPARIVDHAEARARALAAWDAIRR